MMLGVPVCGLVGSAPPAPELEVAGLAPMLPVVDGELLPLVLPEPTVPVVACGTPALPTPVPKFGVTVVLPGPGPPGTPTPDGLPGWPGPAPPGAVLPTLPLVVPLEPLLVPPVCASVIAEEAASMVASSGTRTRISASSEGSLR